jgi:peroxiredoxin
MLRHLAAPAPSPSARRRSREDATMAIKVGDRIPDVTLKTMTEEGIRDVKTKDLFGGRKVVLFALPGAFTPTCSAKHLPGFVEKADQIKARGVDEIVCLSVNDAFVMGAWAKAQGAAGKVTLVADGNGEFSKAVGLDFDGSNFGMGVRSQRYAAVIENGVVKHLAVEKPMKFEVSSAEAILKVL